MTGRRLQYLLEKFLSDNIDDSGMQELQTLIGPAAEDEFLSNVTAMIEAEPAQKEEDHTEEMNRVLKRVLKIDRSSVSIPLKPATHRVIILKRWGWVAAVLLFLFSGMYLWISSKNENKNKQLAGIDTAIGPGRDGAVLTLSDGSQVLLDTISNGLIALQGGANARIENGVLVYEKTGSEVVFNTISTPKRKQFKMILPDQTVVWMNAGSSLRFPTIFSGAERKVETTGEVYFEVAANEKMPFRVAVQQKILVEVLGTEFNIKAYDNEATVDATLIKGAIRVQDTPGRSILLKPGQQASVNKSNGSIAPAMISLNTQVNLQKILAWKNGLFDFDNTKIDEVMRQLERWYDVEVVYENGIPDLTLMGKLSRDISLKELLPGLRELGVNARLEGRKLIVKTTPVL